MTASAVLAHDWFARPLPPNVELGTGSWLYSSFAFLHCRSQREAAVRVGRCTGIYDGSLFELGPDGEVHIGDCCTLVGVIVASNGRVRIGDYCFLAHEVVIADSPFALPPLATEAECGPADAPALCVELGNDVWVGSRATLLRGAKIGDGAIIGAGTVVDFEVPRGGIVAGHPARLVGFAAARTAVRDEPSTARNPASLP